jgi:hypothetical protein
MATKFLELRAPTGDATGIRLRSSSGALVSIEPGLTTPTSQRFLLPPNSSGGTIALTKDIDEVDKKIQELDATLKAALGDDEVVERLITLINEIQEDGDTLLELITKIENAQGDIQVIYKLITELENNLLIQNELNNSREENYKNYGLRVDENGMLDISNLLSAKNQLTLPSGYGLRFGSEGATLLYDEETQTLNLGTNNALLTQSWFKSQNFVTEEYLNQKDFIPKERALVDYCDDYGGFVVFAEKKGTKRAFTVNYNPTTNFVIH